MYLQELLEEKENLEEMLDFAEFDMRVNDNEFTRAKVRYLEQRLENTKRAINRTKEMVKPIYNQEPKSSDKILRVSLQFMGGILAGFLLQVLIFKIVSLFIN